MKFTLRNTRGLFMFLSQAFLLISAVVYLFIACIIMSPVVIPLGILWLISSLFCFWVKDQSENFDDVPTVIKMWYLPMNCALAVSSSILLLIFSLNEKIVDAMIENRLFS